MNDETQILLHEYDTLREEVLHRYDAQFQAIGVFAAVVAALLAAWASKLDGWTIVLVGEVATVAFGLIWYWILHDIRRAASRLRELEALINRIAGKTLLTWETNSKWHLFFDRTPSVD